ncbi:gluconate 2-dehydrogenase subunit 3 family protein [Natronosalvus rutilus]|uniref:Gluconate 2-dehydrogenase subunit 3 family protein n=1 Tax=Natronosalvus rutilus TaxID=2953753 RepID=A0A9E7SVC4_9EURY|nr:gluconate 2-dehydrogenase subunit 3 family protein [Natronosalvus rutilus]UTF53787.1 gluconate 2-dehydrogenase subunit 3 family protein [Natronosalvus rutilus]
MDLTRRDAVAALAALGVGGGAAATLRYGRSRAAKDTTSVDEERIRATLIAAAEVVYPSGIDGVEPFVETFLEGRLADPDHAAAMDETVAKLEELSESWHDARFVALSVADRDRFLRELGADAASEAPEGTTAERVRYYVVNELLLALYTSPTGGELAGLENPQGHPGGIDTYQRGPDS